MDLLMNRNLMTEDIGGPDQGKKTIFGHCFKPIFETKSQLLARTTENVNWQQQFSRRII